MVQVLLAFSEGRANTNDVMRALVSHRGWFVPLGLFALSGGDSRKVDSMLMLSHESLVPPEELWIFTDAEAAHLAQAKGASLGSYAGGMAGTELFSIIEPNFKTVRINPCSPAERTWIFMEGSASTAGRLWAEAVALEEKFGEWEKTGKPDETALRNYRAFLLYDHVSGPIVTLPNLGGMSNPAVAFTAPDCTDNFIAELSDEERAAVRQVTIDGHRLLTIPRQGLDGFIFNFFGPGPTYALRFDSLQPDYPAGA